MKHLRALLINPYIYDVSAYSFWSAPLGLLYMGSVLRRNGFEVQLVDCLATDDSKRKEDGRAPFIQTKVTKPEIAAMVKKRFKRYGISPEALESKLRELEPPDLVLVTSIMTYWYIGALEALAIARAAYPKAKLIAGGLYPSLCREHAERHLEADLVVASPATSRLYAYIEDVLSTSLPFKPDPENLRALPYPCFDLYENLSFVPLLTSVGCPYRCTYCATHYLHPLITRRPAQKVLEELCHWQERGCTRFVLYDDSFLSGKENYAKPLLREVCKRGGLSFYNPNALNASMIDAETALLLKEAGFSEVRIGLETQDPTLQIATGGKVDQRTFEEAIRLLRDAGFDGHSVCVYVLAGLPLQGAEEVRQTVDYVAGLGVRASLAHYSPIPHTPLFERYCGSARYPIAQEPFFQNNALFPFAWEGFTEDEINELKRYVRERNVLLDTPCIAGPSA